MKYDPTMTHQTVTQLFKNHDATRPSEYAREAYDRTDCGVWTTFLTGKGESFHADDMTPTQDTSEWAARHIVGINHGTIVEGSDAEFECDPLFFPFDDEELATAWQACEEFCNDNFGGEDEE